MRVVCDGASQRQWCFDDATVKNTGSQQLSRRHKAVEWRYPGLLDNFRGYGEIEQCGLESLADNIVQEAEG